MNTKSSATPIILIVGILLLFTVATIDLLLNTLAFSYKTLKPYLLAFLSFSREYLSTTLVSLGGRLQSYFYQVDNDSATLPSIVDTLTYAALSKMLKRVASSTLSVVDLGKALGCAGEKLRKVSKYDYMEEVRKAFE